jgi:hypothetical protein
MSNLKLILNNTADLATLTADPLPVNSLPVTMLQDSRRGRALRSVGTTQKILGNHSEVQIADGCALIRLNLTDLATVRLTFYEGENQTGEVMFDTGDAVFGDLIPAGEFSAGFDPFGGSYYTPSLAVMWFTAVFYRSFEISISDPGNADGYINIERLLMGLSFSPEHNFSWNSPLEWVDRSQRRRTAAGGLRVRPQSSYRRLSLILEWITDTDRSRLSSAFRGAKDRDILVSAYPSESGIRLNDYTLVAQLVGGVKFTHAGFNTYRLPLVFEEV